MLRCIRCSACLNHCPVYFTTGGHAYGWVYSGPMGSVLTPALIGMVAFNSLTQNTAYSEGTTLQLTGTIDIAGHSPVTLQSMYAPTDQFIPDGTMVAANVQTTFTRIFSNPYESPVIKSVKLPAHWGEKRLVQ